MKTSTIKLMLIYAGCSIFLMISGCRYYKSFQMNSLTMESVSVVMKHKGVIIVNDNANNKFLLTSVSISDEGVIGTVSPLAPGGHQPHINRTFRNKGHKNEQYDPTTVMHIYYNKSLKDVTDVTLDFDNMMSAEVHENAPGSNAIIPLVTVIGISAAIFATAGVVVILTSGCACPMVETYNDTDTQFHGSLFPGSIFESLTRTDYLELSNYKMNTDSTVNLRIFNNMPEIEYIDQIKVLELDDKNYEKVAAVGINKFVGYNITQTPIWAINEQSDTLTASIVNEDDAIFGFDQLIEDSDINSMVVAFDKETLSDNPIISLVAKQSRWLEEVALFNFNMIGNKHDKWVEKMDKSSSADWYEGQKKQGVSLAVYLKNGAEWDLVGQFDSPGTIEYRNLTMPLDLSTHVGQEVELKFTSAYKLWDINQVALSDDYDNQLQGSYLDIGQVLNHNSEDVTSLVAEKDKNYLVQEMQGDYFNFQVKTTGENTLFVQGTGYYHIKVENDSSPNLAYIKKVKTKGGLHRISKELEYYKAVFVSN